MTIQGVCVCAVRLQPGGRGEVGGKKLQSSHPHCCHDLICARDCAAFDLPSFPRQHRSQVPSPILRYTTPTDMPRSPASNRTLCVNITQGAAFLVQASTLNASTDYAVSAWALVRAAPAGDLPITLRLALQAAFAPRTTLGEAAVVLTQEMGWSQLSLPNLAQLPSVDPAKPAGGAPVLFVLSVDAAAPPGTTVCFDDARLSVPCEHASLSLNGRCVCACVCVGGGVVGEEQMQEEGVF